MKPQLQLRSKASLALAALTAVSALGCGDSEEEETDTCPAVDGYTVVCDDITADTSWSGKVLLRSLVFVSDATLTIAPGTVVEGETGSALVVSATGRINAAGTAAAPIVFTSSKPAAERAAGDFGGVVLLGRAPVNVGSGNIEGMEASAASSYGGSDPAHNCGTLRYVRIEYAGSVFGTDNELNGLTVGGCGTATTLDFIQVHKGLDDGVEFFGGTAGISHLLITQPGDDGLDWDQGWSGNVQFVAVQQATNDGDKGIEADNLEDDNDATPRSAPTLWNVTLVGSGDPAGSQAGMKLRRGTAGHLNNVIITGFPGEAFDIDGEATAAQVAAGTLTMNHVLVFEVGDFSDETGEDDDDGGFDETAFFAGVDGAQTDDPGLGDSTSRTAPNLVPAASSPAELGATPPAPFDVTAKYYGAFAPGAPAWTTGWTAFP
ncbi:MAG: hypothetical protein H6700_10255 [Myxococcales bacterium]|nr:hypothetical protein [Myxococcales bacterium]MCB9532136.1 hypothetical protein [Myxococcales bacterium]